jgi:hypothetical protein
MFPNLSIQNCVNGRRGNAESLAQPNHAAVFSRDVFSANLPHDNFVNNNHRVLSASQRASLRDHIGTVISSSSQKQVRGVYARRVVTTMQYAQAIWDWAVRVNPRYLVRRTYAGLPIAALMFRANPKPATHRFIDTTPKTIKRTLSVFRVITLRRAVSVFIARPTHKRDAAGFTCVWYFKSSQDVNLRYRFADWLGSFIASTAREPFLFYHSYE